MEGDVKGDFAHGKPSVKACYSAEHIIGYKRKKVKEFYHNLMGVAIRFC
jgi:hypothetical protein